MTPTVPIDISWANVISAIVVAFGTMATIIAILMRILFKAVRANVDAQFANSREYMVQLEKRTEGQEEAHDRLRDKWEEFLKEYIKIDSTRGQKIDALFRVVDRMQEVVDKLPLQMNSKIEEAFTQSMSEIKLYARDQIEMYSRRGGGRDAT
jgi:uncharacterized membrane protein YhiD involved in acid resistance